MLPLIGPEWTLSMRKRKDEPLTRPDRLCGKWFEPMTVLDTHTHTHTHTHPDALAF